jgi:pentose-5-phosphate-3-epimerase/putative flippase GtrA
MEALARLTPFESGQRNLWAYFAAHIRVLLYRARYLATFVVIGFSSILLELAILRVFHPAGWSWTARACVGFAFGLLFSFVCNALFNFRVPRRYLLSTFALFTLVSVFSFTSNIVAISLLTTKFRIGYAPARLITSSCLFLFAYLLHRRFTFERARNLGVAVYANGSESLAAIFKKVGYFCDHIHVDLVDETMHASPEPVDLERLTQVRSLWRYVPVHAHIMSRRPGRWLPGVLKHADVILLHAQAEEDLMDLIFEIRRSRKKVGLVWQSGAQASEMLPYLPHLDFVMVLGVTRPGVCGQSPDEGALALVDCLDSLRARYGYELIYDGGVTLTNVGSIPAKYIVSASAILWNDRPTHAALRLKTNSKYER